MSPTAQAQSSPMTTTNENTMLSQQFRLQYQAFSKLWRSATAKPVAAIEPLRFAKQLALRLPVVAACVDEGDFGELNLEVAAVKESTRQAIISGDWQEVDEHFDFLSDLFDSGSNDLKDAIKVSYLGNLFYGESSHAHAEARNRLPRNLAAALANIEHHYHQLRD